MPTNKININHTKTNHNEHNISSLVYVGMFAILECVCEPTLSHQTASIKSLQKCGPYMPMAVLIRASTGTRSHSDEPKSRIRGPLSLGNGKILFQKWQVTNKFTIVGHNFR